MPSIQKIIACMSRKYVRQHEIYSVQYLVCLCARVLVMCVEYTISGTVRYSAHG